MVFMNKLADEIQESEFYLINNIFRCSINRILSDNYLRAVLEYREIAIHNIFAIEFTNECLEKDEFRRRIISETQWNEPLFKKKRKLNKTFILNFRNIKNKNDYLNEKFAHFWKIFDIRYEVRWKFIIIKKINFGKVHFKENSVLFKLFLYFFNKEKFNKNINLKRFSLLLVSLIVNSNFVT
nr:hypothetical protein 1634Bnrm2_p065 [Cryptomonas sp.]